MKNRLVRAVLEWWEENQHYTHVCSGEVELEFVRLAREHSKTTGRKS